MTSDKLQEELGAMLGRCVRVIRELETENAELKAREWQGLTEAEMYAAYESAPARWDRHIRGLRAIEAALKERNA